MMFSQKNVSGNSTCKKTKGTNKSYSTFSRIKNKQGIYLHYMQPMECKETSKLTKMVGGINNSLYINLLGIEGVNARRYLAPSFSKWR